MLSHQDIWEALSASGKSSHAALISLIEHKEWGSGGNRGRDGVIFCKGVWRSLHFSSFCCLNLSLGLIHSFRGLQPCALGQTCNSRLFSRISSHKRRSFGFGGFLWSCYVLSYGNGKWFPLEYQGEGGCLKKGIEPENLAIHSHDYSLLNLYG